MKEMVKLFKVSLLVCWVCLLITFTEGTLQPCALKDYGHDHKVCVCNSTYCDTISRVPKINKDEYIVFISSKEGLRFEKTSGKFSKDKETSQEKHPFLSWLTGTHSVEISVNTAVKYQKIMGFGGAFSDAAGINVMSLNKEAQEHFLRSYFSEEGIEYNLCRVPIGGTDFSTHPYSYDDGAPDPNLERFSLAEEDHKYKIPLIQRAMKITKKDINFVCASWSPPIWMKTNNNFSGFSALKPEYYTTFVKYILRFLDEYKKHNIKFWAVSTGNEPLDGILPIYHFNSLGWTPSNLANWTANYFGPELRQSAHKDILLLTFDDQRSYLPWWIDWMVKADQKVLQYVDGFAVHWYLDFLIGDCVIKSLHQKYPQMFVLYTEACQGDRPWQKKVDIGSWDRGESYIEDIIKNTNAWVVGWIDWNMALSLSGGPNWAKNFVDSPIVVNASAGEFYKQPSFYAMGHVSKFIERDAVRVQLSSTDSSGVLATAVQNPDGRVVVVLVNKNKEAAKVSIKVDNKGWINLDTPPNSFATILCS